MDAQTIRGGVENSAIIARRRVQADRWICAPLSLFVLAVVMGLSAAAWASPVTTTTSTRTPALPGGRVRHVEAPDLGGLSGLSWTATSTAPGTAGVTYSYGFTIPVLGLSITSVTLTVPPGTTGTPTLSSVSGLTGGGTLTLNTSTNTLTYTSTTLVTLLDSATVTVTGLTNTPTGGSYTSTVTVLAGTINEGSGTTNALAFVGPLTLTPPTALAWSGTISTASAGVVDASAAQQQFGVYDNTGSKAGWNVTMSVSSFVSGSTTIGSAGVTVTGSTSSVTSRSLPTTACAISGCTQPTNTTSYPVAVTAGSTTATKIYDTAAGTGVGSITIGPIGWWVTAVPTEPIGSYTSTITFSVVSGP